VTVAELLGKLLAPDSPWLLVVAVLVLVAAAGIARRLFRSVAGIGARVGELERLTDSERTRRRQVEDLLLRLGIPLPYWPPDGPGQPSRPARAAARDASPLEARAERDGYDDFEDDDQDDDLTREHELTRPPVPPFPEAERARLARHRR
jgi:hypothetical protein